MIELADGVVDYGDAPEIFSTGVARLWKVSPGIFRVTLFAERQPMTKIERCAVAHLLWDATVLGPQTRAFLQALESLH